MVPAREDGDALPRSPRRQAERRTVFQASPDRDGDHAGRPDASTALRKAGRGSGSEAILPSPLPGARPSVRVSLPRRRGGATLRRERSVRRGRGLPSVLAPLRRRGPSLFLPLPPPRAARASPFGLGFLHVREEHAAEGGAASSTCRLLLCHSGGRRRLRTSCLAPAPHASAAGSARWASASCAAGAGPSRWCWRGPGWWPRRPRR